MPMCHACPPSGAMGGPPATSSSSYPVEPMMPPAASCTRSEVFRWAQGPSWPKGDMEHMISRGLILSRS